MLGGSALQIALRWSIAAPRAASPQRHLISGSSLSVAEALRTRGLPAEDDSARPMHDQMLPSVWPQSIENIEHACSTW